MTKTERIKKIEAELKVLKAEVEEERVDYPCVGVYGDGLVTFFDSDYTGTHIYTVGTAATFGYKGSGLETSWKPFTGTITYKNGKPV